METWEQPQNKPVYHSPCLFYITCSTRLAKDLIPHVGKLYRAKCYVCTTSNKMLLGQSSTQKNGCILAYFASNVFITMKTQPRNLYQKGNKITMHFSQLVVRQDKYIQTLHSVLSVHKGSIMYSEETLNEAIPNC